MIRKPETVLGLVLFQGFPLSAQPLPTENLIGIFMVQITTPGG